MPSHLLEPLDELQQAVAKSTRGPLAVLAVAGAGKTRAIAHRIAYAVATGEQQAEQGLALTYTTKAAFELRSRLAELGVGGVSVGTIHAVALRQLNYFWPKLVGGNPPNLLANREAELNKLIDQIAPTTTAMEARQVRADFEWAKASGLDFDQFARTRGELPSEHLSLLAALWQQYDEQNLRNQRIDFDDVLTLLTGLLETRPDAAAEVRRRYTWITVDEYQDFTPLQEALLRQWLGDRAELCVVGDANQAIYGFTGADPALLTSFEQRFPDAAVLELDQTYRCRSAIAEFASRLLPSGALRPRAVSEGGEVTLTRWPTADEEVAAVVQQVSQMLAAGADPREIALLVRVGAQLPKYERAFAGVGIAFSNRATISSESPLIRRVLLSLRAAGLNPAGDEMVTALAAALAAAGWVEQDPDSDQWAAGSAMLALAGDLLAQQSDLDLKQYLVELDQRLTALSPPSPLAVSLLTMHSAKGLEWDHVFLPDLNDRLLPYPGVEKESERNLLYVAATRAKRSLHISWAEQDERGWKVGASTLLPEAEELSLRAAHAPRSGGMAESNSVDSVAPRSEDVLDQVSHCRQCGRGLGTSRERLTGRCRMCPEAVNELQLQRLLKWRAEKSLQLGVPALLLLSDARAEQLASSTSWTLDGLRSTLAAVPQLQVLAEELHSLLGQAE